MVLLHRTLLTPGRRTAWCFLTAAGLLGMMTLAAGTGWTTPVPPSREKPVPGSTPAQKDAPPTAPKAKPAEPGLPAEGAPLDQLDPRSPEMQNLRREVERLQQQMLRQMQGGLLPGGGGLRVPGPGGMGALGQGRLGVRVDRPSEVLIDQLDIAPGKGQVIRDIQPDSPAARAGIKRNDVLLEIHGKPVPSDWEAFRTLLNDIKPDALGPVVVLRKGKRETLRELKLPRAAAPPARPGFPMPALPGAGVEIPALPGARAAGLGARIVASTITSDPNGFTCTRQEGSLKLTVKGKKVGGKTQVTEIRVQDGKDEHRYESLDKVPAEYRGKVNDLIESSEKGAVQIEIHSP